MDVSGITDLVELAKGGISTIQSSLGVTKEIRNLLGRSNAPKNDTDAAALALDLTQQLADVLIKYSTIQSGLLTLQSEIEKTNEFEQDMARYQLMTTTGGSSVLALRDEDKSGEPFHYLCPNCRAKGQKSLLQPLGFSQNIRTCGPCDQEFTMNNDAPVPGMRR